MLVELASTPVAAGLFFLYIKDKYEKEPWKMLFLGVLFGLYTAAVVYALGSFLEERFPHEETPFYTAFFSSAVGRRCTVVYFHRKSGKPEKIGCVVNWNRL